MIEGKRVLVFTYTVEYLRELLDACKKRGLSEERMIALTIDSSIPRNVAQIKAIHPKKLEMDKLCSSYNLLRNQVEVQRASTHDHTDFTKKNELEQEFSNRKKQVRQLSDQIMCEIFANVGVIFIPRETVGDSDLIIFRPDVQMIVNAKFYDKDKINVWNILAQVWIKQSSDLVIALLYKKTNIV